MNETTTPATPDIQVKDIVIRAGGPLPGGFLGLYWTIRGDGTIQLNDYLESDEILTLGHWAALERVEPIVERVTALRDEGIVSADLVAYLEKALGVPALVVKDSDWGTLFDFVTGQIALQTGPHLSEGMENDPDAVVRTDEGTPGVDDLEGPTDAPVESASNVSKQERRETAAILTGLRLIQERKVSGQPLNAKLNSIYTDGGEFTGLSGKEIDDLCEEING